MEPRLIPIAPEGYLARRKDFQFSADRIAEKLRLRRREIKMLQCFLEGKTIEELIAKFGYGNDRTRDILLKMSRLLYFRAKDRADITRTEPHNKLVLLQKDGAFWLTKLEGCRPEMEVL